MTRGNILCNSSGELSRTSSSLTKLLSYWLSVDEIYSPWYFRSINVVCVCYILACAIAVRYVSCIYLSNLRH